jgi:hypothetical protein
MVKPLAVLIVGFLVVGEGSGPDFSGGWRLDRSLSDPRTTGPEIRLDVVQRTDSLMVTRQGPETSTITLFFDGRPPSVVPSSSQPHVAADYSRASARLSWKGTQLVIEGGTPAHDDRMATSLREVWRLEQEVLTIDKSFDNGSTEYRLTEVFQRITGD